MKSQLKNQIVREPGSEICQSTTLADRTETKLVDAAIGARVIRSHHFGATLFGDPAWDILLVLYRARLQQQRITVSGLCTAASLPLTTGIRWISNLADAEFVQRVADPYDGRRVFIELSETAASAMRSYLSDVGTQLTFVGGA